MTNIPRKLFATIQEKLLTSNKIIVIYGARRVGKTTLVRQLLAEIPLKTLQINADERRYIEVLSSRDIQKMQLLVDGYEVLFIDEAQRIPDIGINLKILHDNLPNLKIIVTGSSSFDLANRTKESLTGRTWTYSLFPIALTELKNQMNSFEIDQKLEELLVFGSYPDVLNFANQQDKIKYLYELSNSYLYKDIFELSSIKYPDKLRRLLQLLAFQIGSEVSLNELGQSLQMSKDSVNTYIDLLEKAFVVLRLSGYSRNLRKEVVKMDKIYFYDLGIRNAVIENFHLFNLRNDVGQLWENFLVVERQKLNHYNENFMKPYFWRTYTGAELDYIEEGMQKLAGFEFKFGQKISKPPKSWQENYPNATFECINKSNFIEFLV